MANNPTLVQAQALIDAAQGRQAQAGLYPNPSVGYVGSEIGNEGRAGQQGMSVSQEIVRGGKLRLSRTVVAHEIEQAEAQAEAQRLRVLNAVRTAYYRALAAQRTVAAIDIRLLPNSVLDPLTEAERTEAEQKQLVTLATKGVQIADELLKGGQGTRPDVLQAEVELEQVRIIAENAANNYKAAWKQLAAIAGVSGLETTLLTGDLDQGIRELTSDDSLNQILATSPEVRVAEAGVRRAEAALRRAQAEPVPNVTLEAGTQYDYASRDTIVGVGLSLPLPINNRNQGNILAAEAERVRAAREVDRVKLALTNRFATAFARYENARQQVEKYRTRILPKAEETLNLVREGYQKGQFPFLQVLTAQRTLAQANLSYLQSLAELRASIVEIDGLLLSDGLSGGTAGPFDGVAGPRD